MLKERLPDLQQRSKVITHNGIKGDGKKSLHLMTGDGSDA